MLALLALSLLQGDARPVPDFDAEGMHPEVAAVFERARERARQAPRDPEAWWKLGAVFDAHDLFTQAEACYLAAHELAPDDFRYLYLLAVVSDLCGRAREVTVPLFEAALALEPGYAPAHVHFGDALARQGELDDARRAYGRAIEIEPSLYAAHRSLGQVLLGLGELESARAHLEHARSAAEDDRAVNASLAHVYMRLGDRDAARKAASDAGGQSLSLSYRDPVREEVMALAVATGPRFDRATAALNAGDVEGATRELTTILRLHPDNAEALARRGVIRLEHGSLAEALVDLRQAVVHHPSDVAKRLVLGQALLRAGAADASSYRAAVQTLRTASELAPDDQDVAEAYAQALVRRGRDGAAVRQFELAGAGDRPLEETSYQLWGTALARLGRLEEALECFRDAVLFLPTSGMLRFNVGVVLVELGRLEDALVEFDRARAMGVTLAAERAAELRRTLERE
jgi:Flp pilus assembly protein TadD